MKQVWWLLCLCGLIHLAPAQNLGLNKTQNGIFDVVALRVEFQPDTTRFSTGDGTFSNQLWKGLVPKIDPLPHDAAYFQAHLQFLQNYIAKSSKGRATLRTHLIPDVVRVSKPMGAYAPTGKTADSDVERAKLAALVKEAWALASVQTSFQVPTGLDPNRTMFLLFHAGAGRDIELVGSSLNKTPEDLPSIFFNTNTLSRLNGDLPRFKGLTVNNSALIPETESRLGYDPSNRKDFLIELSINGLMAASFLNFLGVPDLFNTKTGETGVGAFCVMDGEGIFSYNGLFPPAPSAWVKAYLGWVMPLDLKPPANGSLTQTIRSFSNTNDGEIYRVSISPTEYFLIENRQRDPEKDGLKLTVWQNGSLKTQTVSNQDKKMSRVDQSDFIGGVVVDADHYDWSLPGGLDRVGNERNGGLLIWHIDENIIQANLASNTINIDPKKRGVDLEEADGSQDIGLASFNCNDDGTNNILRGSYDDYWFLNNPVNCVINTEAKVIGRYTNLFSPDTLPNSASNSGAYTGIVLKDFSAPNPTMTFSVGLIPPSLFVEAVAAANYTLKTTPNSLPPLMGQDARGIWTLERNAPKVFTWKLNGAVHQVVRVSDKLPNFTGLLAPENPLPILADLDLDGRLDGVGIFQNWVFAFNTNGAILPNFPISLPSVSVTQPLLVRFTGQKQGTLLVATMEGMIYGYDLDAGGKLRAGFPLTTGGTLLKTPKVKDGVLLAQAEGQATRGWILSDLASVVWGELLYNEQFSNTMVLTMPVKPDDQEVLLVASETYNWPNPVRTRGTHIRFMCTEDCTVLIRILDLSGAVVARLDETKAFGGLPTEVAWPATNIGSGVYIAQVEAHSATRQESKRIKMAIIR